MEFIPKNEIKTLRSDFQNSQQLLWNENSKSERITITKVTVFPGKTNQRHRHEDSEQIWIALKGKGLLLLGENHTRVFIEGDIVRFEDGDIHGITNPTNEEFVYLSVTSPPINFRYAYNKDEQEIR